MQHVGTYIRLLFHIVATYIKALVMSGDQFLYAFVEKSHRKACQQVLHNVFSLLVIPKPPAGQNNVRLIRKSRIPCFSLFLPSHLLSNYWWPKKRAHFVLRHANSPAVFEQSTPFPQIRSTYCTGPMHIKNLPVNIRNSYHRSHFTGSGIFFYFRVHL
jgi:hypothetical protein